MKSEKNVLDWSTAELREFRAHGARQLSLSRNELQNGQEERKSIRKSEAKEGHRAVVSAHRGRHGRHSRVGVASIHRQLATSLIHGTVRTRSLPQRPKGSDEDKRSALHYINPYQLT